ncbi:hypothetical protein ACWGRF_01980 [Streptomyces zhihengii]
MSEQQTPTWVDDVRAALAFNAAAEHTALITLRDVLLDDASRTPEQALAAARILLAAHARELAADAAEHRSAVNEDMRGNRARVNTCHGMRLAELRITRHANRLDEQS